MSSFRACVATVVGCYWVIADFFCISEMLEIAVLLDDQNNATITHRGTGRLAGPVLSSRDPVGDATGPVWCGKHWGRPEDPPIARQSK